MKVLTECFTYSVETRKTEHLQAIQTPMGYAIRKAFVTLDHMTCKDHMTYKDDYGPWNTIIEIIDEPSINKLKDQNYESLLDPYKKNKFIAKTLTDLKVIILKFNSIYGRETFSRRAPRRSGSGR